MSKLQRYFAADCQKSPTMKVPNGVKQTWVWCRRACVWLAERAIGESKSLHCKWNRTTNHKILRTHFRQYTIQKVFNNRRNIHIKYQPQRGQFTQCNSLNEDIMGWMFSLRLLVAYVMSRFCSAGTESASTAATAQPAQAKRKICQWTHACHFTNGMIFANIKW